MLATKKIKKGKLIIYVVIIGGSLIAALFLLFKDSAPLNFNDLTNEDISTTTGLLSDTNYTSKIIQVETIKESDNLDNEILDVLQKTSINTDTYEVGNKEPFKKDK